MAGCRELGLPAVARRWLTAALVGAAGQAHDRAQLVAAPSNSFLLPNKLVLTTQIPPSASPHLGQCRCPFYFNGLLLCNTPRVNIIDVANPFWPLGVTGWISVCWQMGRDSLQNGPYCPAERAVRCACMAPFGSTVWPSAVATAAVCKHCSLPFRFSAGPRRLWLSSGPARCCGRRRFVPATRLHAYNIIMWKC